MSGRKIAEYSLHVEHDGSETYFRQQATTFTPLEYSPFEALRSGYNSYLRVHHVAVLLLPDGTEVEEVVIRSIKVNCGEKFICPRPHGGGWQVLDDENDNYTVYRRPAPTVRRIFADVSTWLRACAENRSV